MLTLAGTPASCAARDERIIDTCRLAYETFPTTPGRTLHDLLMTARCRRGVSRGGRARAEPRNAIGRRRARASRHDPMNGIGKKLRLYLALTIGHGDVLDGVIKSCRFHGFGQRLDRICDASIQILTSKSTR